ncbi:MAG TPA: flagellar biosynthesis protein FlhB [Candidatus Sumerlaeota bacterium]|nr:flagellar biosynthesis protein FlhB [Candidatus Sumerlaeota bacterium]HPK03243.1 flagellar biosynthesis protein FlhB [Candidatus Sumerlaeota bacterium]
MADHDQEKTEYRSQKKLEESREKGEIPRSTELGTFLVFALFLTFFGIARLAWFEGIGRIMEDLLRFDRHLGAINRDTVGEFLLVPFIKAGAVVAPLFCTILVLSPLVNFCQTGFNIARNKLQPDWGRLNPVNGFKRIFSARQYIEGLKACVKIGLFSLLAWSALLKSVPKLKLLAGQDLTNQLQTMLDISLMIGVRVAILMGVLAVFDYGYQWWEFNKKLLLTHQELKDEMKEREGNPMIKQRQRQIAMQRARRRMMAEVPKAAVIITNPTHYAVALAYDREKHAAPYVAAKGTELMAHRIREIARRHNIPIIENRPLARALYRKVKLGQTIPSEFYKAVAEILAFVFLLKRNRKLGLPAPSVSKVGRVRTD